MAKIIKFGGWSKFFENNNNKNDSYIRNFVLYNCAEILILELPFATQQIGSIVIIKSFLPCIKNNRRIKKK